MNIEEKNGTVVFKRTTDYKPGKNWRNFLIGRPLQTADAPHQTIGKFLGLAVFSSEDRAQPCAMGTCSRSD